LDKKPLISAFEGGRVGREEKRGDFPISPTGRGEGTWEKRKEGKFVITRRYGGKSGGKIPTFFLGKKRNRRKKREEGLIGACRMR